MSYVRTTVALVATMCASLGIAANALAAGQFIAKKGQTTTGLFEVRGSSGTEGKQSFQAAGMEIGCNAVRSQGALTVPGGSLISSSTFKQCTTDVKAGLSPAQIPVAATVKGALELEYEANGNVRVLTPVVIEIKALKCTIETSPEPEVEEEEAGYANERSSSAKLKDFPSGFQSKLSVGVSAYMPNKISGPCAADLKLGGYAYYHGKSSEEVVDGDLGFEEEEGVAPEGWNLETVAKS